MQINETDFKLIDKIEPPIANGVYSCTAGQTVKQEGADIASYSAEQKYAVSYNAFTLSANEVFEVYPANGAIGDFSAVLPFITFSDRSLPWAFGSVPFMALLVLNSNEILEQGEITVKELFNPVQNTYFPDRTAFPEIYTEEDTDLCRYIDISRQTYDDVFPQMQDIPLLAHAKLVDLSKSSDNICNKDGYFSVVLANRFVPTDYTNETVSVCHLVTTFGYSGCGAVPSNYERVRLISLYHWQIRSNSEKGKPFTELITGLSNNCCEIGRGNPGGAAVALPHYTRTGEMTYSLYHSPLAAREISEMPMLHSAHTADGRLIYDKDTGIFDVSYAAAFQLGKLISLSKKEIAAKVLSHRNDNKLSKHRLSLNNMEKIDFKIVGDALLEYLKKRDGNC